MEDLFEIFKEISLFENETQKTNEERLQKLKDLLYDTASVPTNNVNHLTNDRTVSPQQTKKRAKRLNSMPEVESETSVQISEPSQVNTKNHVGKTEEQYTEITEAPIFEKNVQKSKELEMFETELMPPPPTPQILTIEHEDARPKRAAKVKSEQNLKEPKLNTKMPDPPIIKLEHEERKSQMKSAEDSVTISENAPSIISIISEITQIEENKNKENEDNPIASSRGSSFDGESQPRVRIKREKVSIEKVVEKITHSTKVIESDMQLLESNNVNDDEESTMISVSLSTTAAGLKKKSKKKKIPLPIKIERFSMLDVVGSPISSRLRKNSVEKRKETEKQIEEEISDQQKQRTVSVYEDAIDAGEPIKNTSAEIIANETVDLGSAPINTTIVLGPAATDETFIANPAQITFQVEPGQTTFVVNHHNKLSSNGGERSFETAKDSSTTQNNNLLTDDESFEHRQEQKVPVPVKVVQPLSAKPNKIPTRTHELFNPHVQSPVKLKVKAFENAAIDISKSTRSKRTKENMAQIPTSTVTPLIGKLPASTLGGFLTPTQSSNLNSTGATQNKKISCSASKIQTFPKAPTASSLKKSSSNSSTKTLSRENSADDFRKGLHQLAEDRKKQREQKHLLAAQLRETKERERIERMAKLAKAREEKRIKKQQDAEQKKRELEEIQRKLRKEEEAVAAALEATRLKTAKIKADQERQLLTQIKQQKTPVVQNKIMPPPPLYTRYTFEMLHEDDSTDDEDKVTHKRPPVPSWSRKHVRGGAIVMQQYCPTAVIDSFFSVQPMTLDLKILFPDIDARHLKRNSSAVWSTPPRYSQLPKF